MTSDKYCAEKKGPIAMRKIIAVFLILALAVISCTAAADTAITLENVRDYIVGLNEPMELADGTSRPIINFDNAATTPAREFNS